MTFDPTKPVQTRDGRPAKIFATGVVDAIDVATGGRFEGQSILASIAGIDGLQYFHDNGAFWNRDVEDETDLVNVSEPAGEPESANLGLATTAELLAELTARAEVGGYAGYRTVDVD